MSEVTLELIGEMLVRLRDDVASLKTDVASLKTDVADVKDQMIVQTNVLLRLEHRDRNLDGDVLRLLAQVQRHEARIRALEPE